MTYFAKDSKELLNFPSAIAEKLRRDYADGRRKPDSTAARKIVVGVIDNKIMPAYRKSMSDGSAESIKKHRANIVAVQAKRAEELAQH
ncbi:MAG: hypothetical protein M3R22_06905 [Pseudomonadota bacterium]|nr:hypothetical protein [Pseudomonadota bacterium]